MSFLAKIEKGLKETAQFYVFYGLPGLGKTTFSSKFPSPIILDLEAGSNHINVSRINQSDLGDYKSVVTAINELYTSNHQFKTIVIDSVTALEKLIEQEVCLDNKVKTLSDVAWGGGPVAVQQKLNELITLLKKIQNEKQINIIVIAHSQIKSFVDPTHNQSYDRHILQCNQKFGQIITANADHVFFCAYKIDFAKDSKTKRTQAFGSGDRAIYTSWRPGHEAKTRYEIPYEVDLDYQALMNAIQEAKPKTSSEIIDSITALLAKADDLTKQKVEAAMKEAASDVIKLKRIKDKLETMVSA